MHICLVTETFPPEINGVAMTLSRLSRGLAKLGHIVTVIRPRQSSKETPLNDSSIQQIQIPGCPIPGYDSLRFGLPLVGRLKRIIRDVKPDVLYIATEGPLGWAVHRASRELKLPIASGYHTNFQQYLKHYKLPFLEWMAMGYMRRFHNRSALTFVPSPDIKESLETRGFSGLELLGRGIDIELFNPNRRSSSLRMSWGVEGEEPVVLYVGRLAAEKNLQLLTKAFQTFKEMRPNARFVVVGDGPEKAKMEKDCPDALFTGSLVGEELAVHYASADIFFFTSLTETFGNVVTEALASGLVVGAFDYAAPALFIKNGINGWTVDPELGQEGFLEMVRAVADQPEKWDESREKARDRVMDCGWSNIASHFADKLESIVELKADPKRV